MSHDIQAVFTQYTDGMINDMHPQTVAAKHQQARRINQQRLRQAALGAAIGQTPKHISEIRDY